MDQGISQRSFHVARPARERYQFEYELYSLLGKLVLPTFHTARVVAQRLNDHRDVVRNPEQAVRASQVNALALLQELTQTIFRAYCAQRPGVLHRLDRALQQQVGVAQLDAVMKRFVEQFPALVVYQGDMDVESFLASEIGGRSARDIVLEEMLLLWLTNQNPALTTIRELFDDASLQQQAPYIPTINGMRTFFAANPGRQQTDDDDGMADLLAGEDIIDILLAPVRAHPDSIEAQLGFIQQGWGEAIGAQVTRVLTSLDLIREEEKLIFPPGPPAPMFGGDFTIPVFEGPGATVDTSMLEVENFTPDRDWMPEIVMIAKNAYVWLDQLSKHYRRPIRTLAEIPDAELDMLKQAGITGLWLIGLWERSDASKRIKQMMGNEDAVASAYSLYDYQIARALGGEEACQSLRERAWQRGIRLASDMVPNHVGIDGRWVMEHPDWFVSVPYSPFPSYSFDGPNLSNDDRVGIYLEDHYYDKTDASVVFKRVDNVSGDARYVYHGNDGTSMAWNDTAQLNYLNPDVREAVIQTILHVARQFPVIRFDAAMTLAKKHFQRLWYPQPGTGGDIASRADHAMSRAEFDAAMPEEFWREVVDRCAVEAPDTLLLAEAFWLMESYFVRTLGMHRVYNSAFMHILRDEDNAKYRSLMKNTLEFDPEILKRYVNFMNNPDERTAVDQFGKGDKYFGVCTLLATMPGLPMIGHGQIEGYTEKYGMEYQRAYFDEWPDADLVARHEREIFPLLHRRYLFANVDHFLLYDFESAAGGIDENVFAYSNGVGNERALVVYHNVYGTARGWVRLSAPIMKRSGASDERAVVQQTLGEGLGLSGGGDQFCIFRDHASGLEYIRSADELRERGMYVELGAYRCHVFLDFRTVQDNAAGEYAQVTASLGGRGVASVEDARRELFLQPVHGPLRTLLDAELFRAIIDGRGSMVAQEAALDRLETTAAQVYAQIARAMNAPSDAADALATTARNRVERALTVVAAPLAEVNHAPAQAIQRAAPDTTTALSTLFVWALVAPLGELLNDPSGLDRSRSLVDEWLLGRVVVPTFRELGIDETRATHQLQVAKSLLSHAGWAASPRAATVLESLVRDSDTQRALQLNRFEGVLWLNKERLDQMLWWLQTVAQVEATAETGVDAAATDALYAIQSGAETAGYQVGALLDTLEHPADAADDADAADADDADADDADDADAADADDADADDADADADDADDAAAAADDDDADDDDADADADANVDDK